MIRERVVNLLYGHKAGDATVGELGLDRLRQVTLAAATAYAHLIALQKKQS
jgi:hypothetical protein